MKKLLLIAAMSCTLAQAQYMDGNKLLAKMVSGNSIDDMVSLGYVIGVSDSYYGVLHCIPSVVTAGQLQDMVQKFIRENPDTRHLSADLLVGKVLSSKFPCAKKGSSV